MDTNQKEEKVNKQNNAMALIGFILGILSAFLYDKFSIIPIIGIIFSGIGLGTFNPETQKNKWMAWVGLCLSIIYFLMAVNSHTQ